MYVLMHFDTYNCLNMLKRSLLIVEDDTSLRLTLDKLLSPYFDIVQGCGRVASALLLLERKQYDIALIDRVLPDGSGLEIVSHLHDVALQTKVIMMSHLGNNVQKAQGIERGAVDYLAKPIYPAELTLKIRQYLHMYYTQSTEHIQTSNCTLDLLTGMFSSPNTQHIHLRKKESALLACLILHRPQIVTRLTLIQSVWGTSTQPLVSTLDVYMRRIRTKLGRDASIIKTVRGYGYAFCEPQAASPRREYPSADVSQ